MTSADGKGAKGYGTRGPNPKPERGNRSQPMLNRIISRSRRSLPQPSITSLSKHAVLVMLIGCLPVADLQGAELPSPGGPFEFAVRLYADQELEEARGRFEHLAHLGFSEAQRNLAVMLVKGEGGDRNLPSAYAWLAVAAQQGDAQAKALQPKALALIHDEDERASALKLAEQWQQSYTLDAVMHALEPEYSTAQEKPVTWESLDGIKVVDRVQPVYPPRLANRGIEGSAHLQFLLPDHGHPRDLRLISSAHEDFTAATAAVLPKWKFALESPPPAHLYEQRINYTIGSSHKFEQATQDRIEALASKAESGDVAAMYQLGWALEALPVEDSTLTKAQSLRWLHAAALGGLRDAAYDLNTRVRQGSGCVRDVETATRWKDLAAGLRQPDALRSLANERLRAGNQYEAIYYIKGAAASSGRPTDTARLAWMLATIDLDAERQGQRALDLMDSIKSTYLDQAAWHEIRAAALAETEQWKAAIQEQRRGIRLLQQSDIPTADAKSRLDEYQAQRALRLPLDSTPF